ESSYTVDGVPVQVTLFAHQEQDQISVRIESPLVAKQRLKVRFRFPYGSDCHVCPGYDWSKPDQHETILHRKSGQAASFERRLDTTRYYVDLKWESQASVVEKEKHRYQLVPETNDDSFSFSVLFEDNKTEANPATFSETRTNSLREWE